MRAIFYLLFILLPFHALCQTCKIPVDLSANGWKYNAAVISEIFLNLYGEKQLETWLFSNKISRNRIVIQLRFDVDSLGCVLRVKPLQSANRYLSEKQLSELHSYFKKKRVFFHFWYYDDPEYGTIDYQKELACEEIRNKIKNDGYITIYVPFSQSLVLDYVYSKKYPTYVSFLKDQIKSYKKE